MNTKLYVGGIPYSSTNEDLKNHFAQAGEVASAQIIIDKMTGRSKGFGFVTMSTQDEAEKAMSLHETDYEGRKLIVNEARPQSPREHRSFNQKRYNRN